MCQLRKKIAVLLATSVAGTSLSALAEKLEHEYDLQIDRKPVHEMLTEFSRQTGLSMLSLDEPTPAHPEDTLVGPVLGRRTARAALDQILSGTELTYEQVNDDMVAIVRRRSPVRLAYLDASPDLIAAADGTATAEVPVPSDSPTEESRHLEEVVVTAQKREESLQDVPISISVLTGADLDKSTAQGITEALTRVPGVAAISHSQGGGTLITMRGVTASGPVFGGSSPIAYYLDSVPFGLVQTAVAPDANAYDLKRVEILRGPQGTLYGANAQNGVVRVLTNDADLSDFEFKARGALTTTERGGDNYRGDAAINVPLVEGKLAARAVIGYEDWSGWIDQPIRRDANDVELRNARLKVNAQPTEDLSVAMLAWLSRQDYGAPSYSDDREQTATLIDESASTDYDAYGMKIGYDFASFSISSMTSYLEYENAGSVDLINENVPFSLPLFTGFNAHVFSQEVNITSTHPGPWRWAAGTIYRDGKDKTLQHIPEVPPDVSQYLAGWTNTSESYAVFGELSRRLHNDKFEVTLGLRYFNDDVVSTEDPDAPPANPPSYYRDQESFDATTPRAVLTWYPTEDLTIYASYSEGFRSGTPQAFTATGGRLGFPAVKPDTLHNYETGLKAKLMDGRISIDTALFYIDWRDVQQQLTVPFADVPGGVTALVNAPSASGAGVDFGITVHPLDDLEFGINASWNDLTVDGDVISQGVVLFAQGDRLNFSPEYTVGASADYIRPLGSRGLELRFATSANYTSVQGFRTVAGGQQSLAFGDPMLISRASISIGSPAHWEMTLLADNINDEKDAIYGDPFAGSPAPYADVRVRPRTIGMQFDYRFK